MIPGDCRKAAEGPPEGRRRPEPRRGPPAPDPGRPAGAPDADEERASGPVAELAPPVDSVARRGVIDAVLDAVGRVGSRAGCRVTLATSRPGQPGEAGTSEEGTGSRRRRRQHRVRVAAVAPGERSTRRGRTRGQAGARRGARSAATSAGGEQIRRGLHPPDHRSVDSRRLVAGSDTPTPGATRRPQRPGAAHVGQPGVGRVRSAGKTPRSEREDSATGPDSFG